MEHRIFYLKSAKFTKISIVVSLLIHLMSLFAFAWIKFNNEQNAESSIQVAFVKEKRTSFMQRSFPVRQQIIHNPSPQLSYPDQPIYTYANYKPISKINTNLQSGKYSEIGSLKYHSLQSSKPLYSGFQQNKKLLMSIPIKDTPASSKPINICRNISWVSKPVNHNLYESITPKEWFSPDVTGILQSFFSSIRKKIESQKRYPELAKDFGIEGRSGIKMTILEDGNLEKAEIVDSSGNQLLDNAALQSILKAAPFPPIPKDAKQSKIEVSIYLVFKIERT